MPKLLITGGSGFLGSRIAAFYKNKYEIYTPSHSEMDITNEEMVDAEIAKIKPDIVIHCAAVSDVGKCEREPEASLKINVTGAENIARAAGSVGARCIMCSSDQVYFGSTRRESHQENEELAPANHYGRQKLYAEQSCLKINPGSVHLRLSWMYDRETLLPQEHGDFIRTLLANLEQNSEIIYPVHDTRGITNVWEVVKNLEKAWFLPGGVYHFGAPNQRSTYETAVRLFEKLARSNKAFLDKRIVANEEAFRDNPRNLTMSQEKINHLGIYFSDTLDGLYDAMIAAARQS